MKLALATLLLSLTAPAQTPTQPAPHPQDHFRSRIFVYDLRDHKSHLLFTADTVWEAPNWSPDGKYLIANSGGAIYKLTLQPDGTAIPEKLAIPSDYRCNNDKSLSPDGRQLAFSSTPPGGKGSEVFLANADGTGVKQMTFQSPSYFHGWSPDGKTLAFVAQRDNSGQYDVYTIPAAGGTETRRNVDPHQDDGPDYSPDGKWIYINSDRSGKEAIWRFPATGAGPNDNLAQKVVDDSLQDWFPHISPDGQHLVYIGYPAGTPTHNSRDLHIALKLTTIQHDQVTPGASVAVEANGGQGSMNVNSWSPDSNRFAYVTFEALP